PPDRVPSADEPSAPHSGFSPRHKSAHDPRCAPSAECETQPTPPPQAAHSPQHPKDSRTTSANPPPPIAARAKPRAQPPAHPSQYRATTVRLMTYRLQKRSLHPQVRIESSRRLRWKSATACTKLMISGCGLSSRDE